MLPCSAKVPLSRIFRGRAAECPAMAESFRAEKTREHLLEVAADYESMADHEAEFELEDAHHAAESRYFNFCLKTVVRWRRLAMTHRTSRRTATAVTARRPA